MTANTLVVRNMAAVVLVISLITVAGLTYVRESLATPQAKAQAGYPPSMPSFDGLIREREIAALVSYLRQL